MTHFDFIPTPLAGVILVQRKTIEDQRGFLSRFYCAEQFRAAGIERTICQMNYTCTRRKGTVRGLHFQFPPHAEAKLVSCLHGEVWDVAVDLRPDSATFLQWHGEVLSSANRRSLFIPEGCAHGFQTLDTDCELMYLHSAAYQPAAEGGLNAQDPRLHISWPLPVEELSERDRSHPFIRPDFQGVVL